MPHSLKVAALTESTATKSAIETAFAGKRSIRLETHLGSLSSLNGQIANNMDSIDLLLVDMDIDSQEEMAHLERLAQQHRKKTAVIVTAGDITTYGIRRLLKQGVDDFVPQPLEPVARIDRHVERLENDSRALQSRVKSRLA